MPTRAWGAGGAGQLGDNTILTRSSPVLVVGGHEFIAVAAGGGVSAGLKANGEVWTWGDNPSGSLGDNTILNRSSPVLVVGAHSFAEVVAGGDNAIGGGNRGTVLARKADGSAWAWGINSQGQLGDNSITSRSSPVPVVGAHSFVQLSAGRPTLGGGAMPSFGRKADGSVWAWGGNNSGALGINAAGHRSSPVLVVGAHSFTTVSAGANHAVARKADGAAWTWGFNSTGQLGDNTILNKSSPVAIIGAHSFTQVAAGSLHTLGLKANGEVWTWGDNRYGQLGDNTILNRSSPVLVVGAHSFARVSAGDMFSFGVKADGSAWAWGINSSAELGDNTLVSHSSPVLVVGGFTFAALSGGGNHTLGLLDIRCYYTPLQVFPDAQIVAVNQVLALTTPGVAGGVNYGDVSYAWTTTAGVITGNGLSASLDLTGIAVGVDVTVTVTATSSLGGCVSTGIATIAIRGLCTDARMDRSRFLVGRQSSRHWLSDIALAGFLARGERDVALQALAFQERETIRVTAGTDSYAVATDYVTTWAMHRGLFTVGLRLYDANAVPWYLMVSAAGSPAFTATAPAVILGTGTPTSLRLTDELATLRYISPSIAGAIVIATSPPAGTVVTSTVELRDGYGTPWYPTVTSAPLLVPVHTGTATLSAAAVEPKALLYVDPRAFEHLDPRDTSAAPIYYTVYPSKRLRVYPVPNATYDLVHYYFGDGLTNCDVPKQFEQESIWLAVRLAMLRRGQQSGLLAAGQMAQMGLRRLGPRYLPRHDELAAYVMPSGRRPAPTPQEG